jgi:uroporphyrinogen decarboxylase
MSRLAEVTARYLEAQVRAGADVVQLFDSWLGLVDPVMYRERVAPYTALIFERLRDLAPTIHFSTGTVQLLPEIAATRPSMVSVDWRLPIDRAWDAIGGDLGIQGNLDPTMLLASWETVRTGASDVLVRAGGRPGHIFNLGHGLLPETNPDQLARLVELVHGYRQDGENDIAGPAE